MKVIHLRKIDSTSSYLKRNYHKLNNFTVVYADYQTSGHGRMNRCWESNSNDNLLFSILIKNQNLINKYKNISLSMAVAIYNVLKKMKIDNVSIKWPNDVYVNDKKICGILLESISNELNIDVLVIGIGLNVNQKKFNELNATSIYNITNKKKNIFWFKNSVFKECYRILNEIIDDNFNYLSIVRNNNYLKDKEVYATIDNEKKLVKVIDINEDNSLKIIVDNNEKNIYFGEITFH